MAVGALVVVASLLLPLGLVTVWIREQVLDTNNFVDTAGSLAGNLAVQREVSDKVSTALIRQVGAGANVPAPLSTGTDAAIRTATASVVASSNFQTLWASSVRTGQEDALRVAKGEPVSGVQTQNGRVVVNLDPVVDAVVAQLPGPIAALVPPATTNDDIQLFEVRDLTSAQTVVRALDDAWWAPTLLSIALFAAAVAIASRRRRAVLWVGCGIAISSILTFVALLVGRAGLLDALDGGVSDGAARAIVDALLDPLRSEIWVTLGVGVVLGAGAVVFGLLDHASSAPVSPDGPEEASGSSPAPLPGSEPTVADRATMPDPDRTSGRPVEPAPSTTSGPRSSL